MRATPKRQTTKSHQLDKLFERWVNSYPTRQRHGFHRDGIVDEDAYRLQADRVLFVLLEPNSRAGRYDRFYGDDLRRIFREENLNKELNVNLAIWTRALLDQKTDYIRPSANGTADQIRRIAILNLKKIGGSGKADYEAISIQAWQDRDFIRKEVRIISPTVVVTCGNNANRLFGWIMKNNPFADIPDEVWNHGGIHVLPANHPSLRPKHAKDALSRLIQRARTARLASFSKVDSARSNSSDVRT